MRAIFSFLLIIIFWLNAVSSDSISGMQKRKEPATQKTAVAANTDIIHSDSIAGYSINVNGRQNSVQITSYTLVEKSPETGSMPKIKSNSVEINGEGNSVSVSQDNQNSKVNISQNGNNNQISITQNKQ